MFGPERTATGRSRTSVESRSPVVGSSPFVRLRIGARPGSAVTTGAKDALGTATTTRFAASSGAAATVSAATSERSTCDRYRGFRPVWRIDSACAGSRHARVTAWPWSRSSRAKAVPHEPPPTTTTSITRTAGSRSTRGRPGARTAPAARSRPSTRSRASRAEDR